jgi:leucyl-tRNA synthetase
MDSAHSFRVRLINYKIQKKKQKCLTDIKEKPTVGIIYAAKTWPSWQSIILTSMKNLYIVSILFIT